MVKIQEAENQIITDYEVFEKRASDSDLLVPAVEKHQKQFGKVPELVAADAGFYSAAKGRKLRVDTTVVEPSSGGGSSMPSF